MATAQKSAAAKAKKKVRKNVSTGIASNSQSTFNNTVMTITDVNGNAILVIEQAPAASKGSREQLAAEKLAAEEAARKAQDTASGRSQCSSRAPARVVERAPRPPDRGLQGHSHPRHHANPAQRLPSPQSAAACDALDPSESSTKTVMARYGRPSARSAAAKA